MYGRSGSPYPQTRLIEPISRDPEPGSLCSSRQVIKRAKGGVLLFSVVSVVLMTGVTSLPTAAQAGIFSDVFSVITEKAQAFGKQFQRTENVQNMTLPSAATNIDPNPSVGGGDITIIDGSALAPAEGPTGTVADVVEPKSRQISVYVVREGDNLSTIAELFGVSVNTIKWANDISKGDTIQIGQTLTILPISGLEYKVQKGDTLASIAKEYKGDTTEIAQFNDLEVSGALAVGTVVIIPNGEMAMTSTRAVVTTSSVAHDTGGPSLSGYYIAPVTGYVRTQGLHGYNAVDMGARTGTPILAAAAGDVIISRASGWNGGYGIYVVIRHANGTQTLYSHMSKDIVSVGQRVQQGQVIGYVGTTGLSTGPHLHFEIRGAKNPF